MNRDTIFALASGPGRAGIAVYRLSGPQAGPALAALGGTADPAPRRALRIRLGFEGEAIDDGLALWFPGPASFTGEDVVELHLHGGPAVGQALTGALMALGLRPAEPGEFSRRAYQAGKLDLTQAEAIADLVAAETDAQRRQALRQLDGALGRLYDGWRDRLLGALALFEAEIDFSDEDLPDGLTRQARAAVEALAGEITLHLDDDRQGEKLRDGVWVALLGHVNVGKSSLLNRLAGREAAIVTPVAGTTRDIVEVRLDIAGLPVSLADTAGLRDTDEAVEAEGIRRARERGRLSDLRLVVFDATHLPAIDAESRRLLAEEAGTGPAVAVFNKLDKAGGPVPAALDGIATVAVSALTGEGLDRLMATLEERLGPGLAAAAPLTRARHRRAAADALAALQAALNAPLPELAAEDVRLAARSLGRISGHIDVEDVLDAIFRDFCIGK